MFTSCARIDRFYEPKETCKTLGFTSNESIAECVKKIQQTEKELSKIKKTGKFQVLPTPINNNSQVLILRKKNHPSFNLNKETVTKKVKELNDSLQLMQQELQMIDPPQFKLNCRVQSGHTLSRSRTYYSWWECYTQE